jgi:nucleoside-diphosphate-sugar epimerase
MKVLVTGAAGLIGKSVVEELLNLHHCVRAFDMRNSKAKALERKKKKVVEWRFGDLRNIADVSDAVRGMDVVIHLGAIIPPLSNKNPQFAEYVNVDGTENVIRAIKKRNPYCRLIFTSSVSVYGDRRKNPLIRPTDPPNPNPGDAYALQKAECEALIRASGLTWAIFRLTYVVSPEKLKLDPVMFEMPLETSIEICHVGDVGLALSRAVSEERVWGKIMHIAGGEKCRTTYREYLDRMMQLFGLGQGFLPEGAFSTQRSYCGHMVCGLSQQLLHFQRYELEDYYREVERQYCMKRLLLTLIRPLAQHCVLNRSPYYRRLRRISKDKQTDLPGKVQHSAG